ncbi:magnesium transporter [Myxococcota bacterium]|nr:magnesium transporter [Myxococcota bacterium]MBU1382257.1 magnesium transporter [Myxococcota bacterium]MBU1496265.1 magnesium transporter [Myxococcota bacterium]
MQNPKLQVLSMTVTKLLHRDAYGPLKKILAKRHPAEMAYFFRDLTPADRSRLFATIDDIEMRAEVLVELDLPIQVELVSSVPAEDAIAMFHYMENDDLADLMEELDDDLREKLLETMGDEDQEAVEELLAYDSSTAGGIMNPSFLSFNQNTSAQDAISHLQGSSEDYATTFYIYVINSSEKLIGVVSLRQLVTCRPSTKLSELMTPDVISVPIYMDQEEVAEVVQRYGFLAVPVVDENYRIVGVVTVDDVIEVIREEATEDIFKMAGAGDDILYFQEPFLQGLIPRLSALIFPTIGGLTSSIILALVGKMFLGGVMYLLFFIPLFLLFATNITNQTSTLIIRALAMRRITENAFSRVIGRETFTGLTIGAVLGLFVFGLSFIPVFGVINFHFKYHIIVGATVTLSLMVTAFLAAFLPLTFKRMQLDPASISGGTLFGIANLTSVGIFIALISIFR